MSKVELQKAIDCLSIQDVFQRAAIAKISDGLIQNTLLKKSLVYS